ncbi:MAG: transporter substrate-binding domain-containing protein, partial [Clostridia bacterium]|nr:transporter substrate-binding domain-containing protein [Clostridia bacterium]
NKKVNLGLPTGTMGQAYTEGFENLSPQYYGSAALAVQDMVNGRISYVVTDIAPAKALAAQEQYKDKIKVIDIALTDEVYCFAVRPGEDKLKEQLNEFMVKNSAKLLALQEAYIAGTNEVVKIDSGNRSARNALIVATNAEFAPFEYLIGESYAGYDMEVIQMFCQQYNYELIIDNMEFDSVVQSVSSKKAHVGAAALTLTPERAEMVNFTNPYYSSTQVVICLADDTTFDDCKTVEDVENILKSM